MMNFYNAKKLNSVQYALRTSVFTVCLLTFTQIANAKDFLTNPEEKELIVCSDGTKLKGTYYHTSCKIKSIKVSADNKYLLVYDEKGRTRIIDKETFNIVYEDKTFAVNSCQNMLMGQGLLFCSPADEYFQREMGAQILMNRTSDKVAAGVVAGAIGGAIGGALYGLLTSNVILPFIRTYGDGYMHYKRKSFKDYGDVTFYNYNNEKVWSGEGAVLSILDKQNIAIFCDRTAGSFREGHVQGIDLATGKVLWTNTIPYRSHLPWGESYSIENLPDNLYLISDSLLLLNTKLGSVKFHEFKSNVKASVASSFGLAANVPMTSKEWYDESCIPENKMGVKTGTHSKWVRSGDSLYIADAENLYCFDSSLNELWHTALPEGTGSKSTLQMYGNKLYLLNYGVAFQSNKLCRCGKLFYATYDKNTGEQLQLVYPKSKHKIYGGRIVPGKTYLQDMLDFYYINEGSEDVHKIKWTPDTKTQPKDYYPEKVIYDTVYVRKDGALEPVTTNADQLVVELNDYDINVIKSNGEVTKYAGTKVYIREKGNIYKTNNKNASNYAITAPDSKKILGEFLFLGFCNILENGDIWVVDEYGIGVVKDPFHLGK